MASNAASASSSVQPTLIPYPSMEWPTSLDIPLKASEELVSIDLLTDLPSDPADLRTLLVEESSSREHWLTIAAAYANQNLTLEAIQLIKMALEVFLQDSEGLAHCHTFLTWCYLKLSKTTKVPQDHDTYLNDAENHLKEAVKINPTWIGNMLATVDLYYQRGAYDKALETCDLFVKGVQQDTKKHNVMFLLLRAKLLFRKKNYVASLKLFQELLVSNPVLKPDPRIGIGACFWHLKDYKMAIKSWERATQLDANSSASILCLLGKFHNSLTESENDTQFKENYTASLMDLNTLYNDTNHPENKENPVLLTLLQSYFYYKNDFENVLKIYDEKIKPISTLVADSILSESTLWCGRAYYALDDYRKAFAMFQESLKTNEENLLAKLGLGQAQLKTNLLEESILTFENLYKSHAGIQELNYILGMLYAGKCFAAAGQNHESTSTTTTMSGKEISILNAKALQFLEKYIKLTTAKKNQLVIPRAYLTISQLYEKTNQYKQSLDYLTKALEEIQFINKDNVPLELLNNIGSFYFINGDADKAKEYFDLAKSKLSNDSSSLTTINYNIARTLETKDLEKSQVLYQDILNEHPNYIAAKIRTLFFKFVNGNESIKDEMTNLAKMNDSDLEVRSFYAWYLKNTTLKNEKEKETSYNKDTLVKYDSHDLYALISLGNLYCLIAREGRKNVKSLKEQEKSKHSYLKAIQLFQKVLQIDPFNVFAAQGIAIIFAESKRLGAAVEILRKVRDSLDNEDVHINLANCLLEMREFSKAIENYDLILKKFPNIKNKSHILNLLGKAWYARGLKEKNIDYFFKALSYTEMAIEFEENRDTSKKNERFIAILKFNVAILDFQIAETLRRSEKKDRTLEHLKTAVVGLDKAIVILKELKDLKDFNVILKDELEQRIQLGETTMKTVLERCVTEQEQYENEQAGKLTEGRRLLEEQELKEKEKKQKQEEEERSKLERQAEEYKKLQAEAQKLIQERETLIVNEDSDVDNDFSGEDGEGKKKKKRKRATATGEKKQRKKRKSKSALSDEGEEAEGSSDDDDTVKVRSRGKKSGLSKEFVVDSDDSDLSSPDIETAEQDAANDDEGLF
ncbi:hypothetical protein NCAS_0C04350 [Naumovozyma castellii]|uniref:Uncharacterized protein n=1 Tax=Naumovozyma castellii TaxID=27288 RepID=G0VD63_NAUCA|nr:hypothetical protein NCAS_0C04350 [Naumovozyma castellii CBS 4309]CCC69425.1 hypothetical protein NCAS_0C04350 [Naumovozyma castellii CBS 4309]